MFSVGPFHFLMLAAMLFTAGFVGLIWHRRNLLLFLLCLELLFLAANINFVVFARQLGDVTGHVFVLLNLAVAAAESAIGLALFVVYFRDKKNLALDKPVLKG